MASTGNPFAGLVRGGLRGAGITGQAAGGVFIVKRLVAAVIFNVIAITAAVVAFVFRPPKRDAQEDAKKMRARRGMTAFGAVFLVVAALLSIGTGVDAYFRITNRSYAAAAGLGELRRMIW